MTTPSGVSLLPGIDVEDKFWTDGLGPWQLKQLRQCGLAIAVSAHSLQPEILDGEYSKLELLTSLYFQALLLCGAHLTDVPIVLLGATVGGRDKLRQYSKAEAIYETVGQPYTLVDETRLAKVDAVYSGLLACHSDIETFRRFRQGLRSIFAGMGEHSCDDRAYFFARALEALHATRKGEGKSLFVSKCQQVTDTDAHHKELFDDLYEIRNNVVHVNDFDALQKTGEDRKQAEARVTAICSDVEILVKEVYRRLLSDAPLLANFETDASIRNYWTGSPAWSLP